VRQVPYWTDRTPPPGDIPKQSSPARAQVAVIGAGYTGLNAGMRLAQSGAEVTILDAHSVGWGASSRNGGFFGPGLVTGAATLRARYGDATAKALWEWAEGARDYLVDTIEGNAIDCDFTTCGALHLAYKPGHLESLREEGEIQAAWLGVEPAPILPREALSDQIGSAAFHGAALHESNGVLDPAKYVFGLARAAADAGVRLVEKAQVLSVERRGTAFHLVTTRGEMVAERVLLATNGYTPGISRRARAGVISGACYTIVTAPLPEALRRSVSPRGRCFFDSRLLLSYFRLTPDGRLLFGGSSSLAPDRDLGNRARDLRRRMLYAFPQLAEVEITHVWTGRLGLTFDRMPHIGQADGLFYAYGYNGHGVALASRMGAEVADLMSGERAHSPFMEIPHPRYPFAPLERLYMPVADLGFRLLDRMS
jgi:glycine/D-amino acid oxidase-like deaminating enzyme